MQKESSHSSLRITFLQNELSHSMKKTDRKMQFQKINLTESG
jgi:hypothetical protein